MMPTARRYLLGIGQDLRDSRGEPGSSEPVCAQLDLHCINTWGFGVGIAHGLASTVTVRFGLLAFSLAMAAVAVVMMISFVTVPALLLGLKVHRPMSQKLASSAVGGALSAVAQAPGFLSELALPRPTSVTRSSRPWP